MKQLYCVEFIITAEGVGGKVTSAEIKKETEKQIVLDKSSSEFGYRSHIRKDELFTTHIGGTLRSNYNYIVAKVYCFEDGLMAAKGAVKEKAFEMFSEHESRFNKVKELVHAYEYEQLTK